MTQRRGQGVAVVVVASGGGSFLDRALASLDWATARVVWDPSHRVPAGGLPSGTRHVHTARELASTTNEPWHLLLREDEVAPAALAGAVDAAMGSGSARGFRLPQLLRAGAGALQPCVPPVRLAPCDWVPGIRADGELCFVGPGAVAGVLRSHVLIEPPEEPVAVTAHIEARSRVTAAILAEALVRPRARRVVRSGLLSTLRILCGRATGGIGWYRWLLAVSAGYTASVAEVRLWEQGFLEGVGAA